MTVRKEFLLTIVLFALGSAWASDRAARFNASSAANPVRTSVGSATASSEYLALGDSIPFGFINQAGFEYSNPDNFVGYPDWTSIALELDDANAACPGEATGSFLSSQQPDLGCRLYRSHTRLHVDYGSAATQMEYATNFLQQHGNTSLVTIQVGSNDVLLLEIACHYDPTCIANGIQQVYAQAAANMGTILGNLRATNYSGPIVIVNYYSIDYSDQTVTALTYGLDQAIAAPAPLYGAVVADVFSVFQAVAAQAGGKPCVAGLLNAKVNSQNVLTCDGHPSQSGHKLITQTILQLNPVRQEYRTWRVPCHGWQSFGASANC
jgi:lysophospholipase L1-like esterase